MIDKDFILKCMHESRKAQRNYSDRKVDQETVDFLTEIAVNAPSKQNEVDFTLAVITNEDMLKEHEERFTWGYHWDKVNSAMHNTQVHAPLIFVYGKTLPEDIHEDIWAADEDGPGVNELFEDTFRDTQNKSIGISSGQMVLAAHMMGLKTGYSQNTMHNESGNAWKEFLGYDKSDYYDPMLVVGVGYPDESLAWYETRNLEYVVASEEEPEGLDSRPFLEVVSNDIRQYPHSDTFIFEPRSAELDGTPIPKNVKVKRFF